MRLYYTLTTIDPIIITENNTSTHDHQCLDYIPGSTVLGALASRLYNTLSAAESWSLFHSGETRFGPCYPLTGQDLALPTPASWHFAKGDSEALFYTTSDQQAQHYQRHLLSNHSAADFQRIDGTQYKQCRDGYISHTGAIGQVVQGVTTRTALSALTGKAADSQLFSYRYIAAGQTFLGWVDSEQSLEILQQHFNSRFRLGRSRNTEFGRVQLTIQTPTVATVAPINDPTQLTLWCLSDSEFISKTGLPTLTPALSQLIPEAQGQLNTQRSFIRHRRVSRFNQQRQGYDSEQCLVAAGSVLVYDLDQPLSDTTLLALSQQPVGINTQQGLGWVMVNPAWNASADLSSTTLFAGLSIATDIEDSEVPANTALTQWVSQKLGQQQQQQQTQQAAQQLVDAVITAYWRARKYNNIVPQHEAGPSSSQWRRISDQLRYNHAQWQQQLFVGEHAICKASNDRLGWGISWDNGQQPITFADNLYQLLQGCNISVLKEAVETICRYDLSSHRDLQSAIQELLKQPITTPSSDAAEAKL